MMKNKVLGCFRTNGGLKQKDLTQLARFEYLAPVSDLPAKLSVNIGMVYSQGGWKENPSSLRFDSLVEAERFLKEVLRAVTFYGAYTGVIREANYSWKLSSYQKMVSEEFIHVMRSI